LEISIRVELQELKLLISNVIMRPIAMLEMVYLNVLDGVKFARIIFA
jgi:hypothetical protein